MYIPLFSEFHPRRRLERRKGGGGKGGGGKGSGGKGGKGGKGGSSKSSSGSGGGKKSKVPLSGGGLFGKSSATSYGYGGGKAAIIPAGQPFAGRSAGGGTRDQIYGTKYVVLWPGCFTGLNGPAERMEVDTLVLEAGVF